MRFITQFKTAFLIICGICLSAGLSGREFTVLVYNVENLFDCDGVALYDDYKPVDDEGNPRYTASQMCRKIENLTRVLQQFNDGKGPEVVVFQEFELDRTPQTGVDDLNAFVEKYSDVSLADMLNPFSPDFPLLSGYPVEAFVYKHLIDQGLENYLIAQQSVEAESIEKFPAHKNIIFSQFPIDQVIAHPMEQARDILEVHLDIDGKTFVILDNHWKSGASSADTEVIRVKNAKVLRTRLDELLKVNPDADILLAGDFNCYYNHALRMPDIEVTGMNHILKSQGDEMALIKRDSADLYNLYYELPPRERKSEPYKGVWGTLMQMLITRGLYDFNGIQYVDNSFQVAIFKGLNADTRMGMPFAWHTLDGGNGFSDHFPVFARFRTVEDDDAGKYLELQNPGVESMRDCELVKVDYDSLDPDDFPVILGVKEDPVPEYGGFYRVKARFISRKPYQIQLLDGQIYDMYSYDEENMEIIRRIRLKTRVEFAGRFSEYRGRPQFIISGKGSKWLRPSSLNKNAHED